MCGIAGIWGEGNIQPMVDILTHRGPDEEGVHVSDAGDADPVKLGVRRLKVIDLKTGSQPIYNEDRSMVIVYNGEVFNYPDLREELIGLGARKRSLKSKLVGGAQMFELPGASSAEAKLACGPSVNIGARNIIAAREALEKLNVPIEGEDTGGNHGRTVRFDTSTGEVEVSSIRFGKSTL